MHHVFQQLQPRQLQQKYAFLAFLDSIGFVIRIWSNLIWLDSEDLVGKQSMVLQSYAVYALL